MSLSIQVHNQSAGGPTQPIVFDLQAHPDLAFLWSDLPELASAVYAVVTAWSGGFRARWDALKALGDVLVALAEKYHAKTVPVESITAQAFSAAGWEDLLISLVPVFLEIIRKRRESRGT